MSQGDKGWLSNLQATAFGIAGTAFVALFGPTVVSFWKHNFHQAPPAWLGEFSRNAVPAGIIFLIVWMIGYSAKRNFAQRSHKTDTAKGNRIAIYIAQLDGDDAVGTTRQLVIDTVLSELGRETTEVIRAGICFRANEIGSADRDTADVKIRAQALLAEKNGQLLIWGRIYDVREGRRLSLHFISASLDGDEKGSRPAITPELLLEPRFITDVGGALAAVALVEARNAKDLSGSYLLEQVKPIADRLAKLQSKLPLSMSADDRGAVHLASGFTQFVLGWHASDIPMLESSARAFKFAMEEYTLERVPLQWALALNNLGNVFVQLGQREKGTERLLEGVQAFRDVLEVWTQELVPYEWAGAQGNLGTALVAVGRQSVGGKQSHEAIQAFRNALKVMTRERVPLDWAKMQNNLAMALLAIEEREGGTNHLFEALEALQAAIEELPHERVPLYWAMTQDNVGSVLHRLGYIEDKVEYLRQSVEKFHGALKVRTRERVPRNWATTKNNLGNALRSLGQAENSTGRLNQAILAHLDALKESARERDPIAWALTQNNLGSALWTLAQLECDSDIMHKALSHYRDALKEITRNDIPLLWAAIHSNIGDVLRFLSRADGTAETLEAALLAYNVCLEIVTHVWPPDWVRDVSLDRDLVLLLLARRSIGSAIAVHSTGVTDWLWYPLINCSLSGVSQSTHMRRG